jgi:hypothetical protein
VGRGIGRRQIAPLPTSLLTIEFLAEAGWGLVLKLPWLWLAQKLPAWIVRRFYSTAKALERFDVDLRSVRGISIVRGAIPELEIFLRFTNRNPFDVHVWRVDFPDIWFGQPLLTNVQQLVDWKIPSNSVQPDFGYDRSGGQRAMPLYFRLQLGKERLDYVLGQVKDGKLQNDPSLTIDVHVKSPVGEFIKKDVYIQVPAFQVGGI